MLWVHKEPSQGEGSFEHPKHMFKLMGMKILTILHSKHCLSIPMCAAKQFSLFQTDWRWLRQFYYETVLRDLESKVTLLCWTCAMGV